MRFYNLIHLLAILPLPPENINWIITNHQQLDMIIFMWSARCHSPSLDHQATYKIIASRDCGCCPTTTNNTTVICTDLPVDGSVCTLAIQTVVCGITGELSHNISVQVDVSNKSNINNIHERYNYCEVMHFFYR